MKRGMSRFFSILLVLCMIISMIPMTAFAATPDTLYLKPNANWLADGARFAAYFYGSGDTWVSMADSNGDGVYECSVPSGYSSVIFCRMNPGSTTNSWDNKWNQSSDLSIPTDGNNCYTIAEDTWDAGGGSWSYYSRDFYLFGFINGANYGCDEDAANIGTYKFENGKLTATFDVESYVGVKTGDNAKWYMTEGFQGTSKTVTLIATDVGIAAPDKVYVPAGIKVNFTLTENADGTLTLKYSVTKSTCKHLFYTNGKCNACGTACTHSFNGDTCTKCGKVCTHTWDNGSCTVCGMACDHSYSGGKCTVCGKAEPTCSHSYTSKVTTAATCENAGVKTFTCSKCGDTYTQSIAATGHSYKSVVTAPTCTEKGYTTYTCSTCSNTYQANETNAKGHTYSKGSCTVCGALDPSYTVTDTGFVLVTDISQITEGKYVLVANNSGSYQAMGTTLSSGKIAGVSVTVDGRVVTGSNLPVWNVEKVTGGIAISLDGSYLAYNSSTNFKMATSAYTWAVTAGETGFILDCSSSRGIYYQISTGKFGAYATSNVNSSSYISNLQLYKYQVGTQGCSHSYTAKVTSEATCEKTGTKTFTCSLCGNSYTETIAALGHSYTEGTCTTCGAADPNYNLTYYLVGFINGANHGCEEDASNMGSYKFASSKLTATFTADSYVFVKTEGNSKWFRAESYCTDTTCKMYVGASEKLYVPGGIKVTFTLTENTDGSITLKYTKTASSCQHLMHSQAGVCNACGKTVSHSWDNSGCTVCGATCAHSYTSKVTTAATCTATGVKTFTCGTCGHSYTETIATISHSYSNGSCTVCGGLDPSYTVTDTGFVLVTDPTQITAGGKFVLVVNNNGSYLAMDDTLASGKFAAVSVTVNGRVVTGTDLPIWTVEAVSGGIALRNDSGYLAYNSSTNFKLADSAYTWTISSGNNGYILNASATTRGIYYQLSANKFGAYSTSYVNSSSYISNLQLYKYQVGTQGCSHSYTSKVTSESTCEKAGTKTFTCSLCGNSYTETIAALGHSYTEGTCTTCGAADPNYNLTYYLVGFINGANHGCEEDASNMGSYKFASGKLTATFTADSYVFVKTEGNSKWFMAESYCTDTTCKMFIGGNEKLYVPGGIKVTFTLTENTDGSITLKYTKTASSCQHLMHSQEGVCNACGKTVSHSWDNSGCTVCGATCAHSYTSKVTSEATCTAEGVTTYTCSVCAHSYTQAIPVTAHSYANGNCTACGAVDPSYTVTDTGFVLVTDPTQITAGGKFVLVVNNNGSYLAMDDTLTSGKFAAVNVTVNGRVVTGTDLPIWTVEAVSGGIALRNDTGYLVYNSSTNFKLADSAYTWTVSSGNNGYILNASATSRGVYYQLSANKFGAYSTSYVNSSSYISNLQLYKYQVGTQGCSHSYTYKITTEATCDKAGVRTYTCALCDHSYTETIAALGHSYASGSCTTCGAADPNYSVTYYLVGFINGANHGCEEDASNMGSYQFSGGKLTATFTADSYVFVKTQNNEKWYMAEAYCTDTTCKMVVGGNEKLYVPGGIKVTFTLTENTDGSITLKYTKTASSCQHLSHTQEGVCNACGKTVSHTWSSGACSVCGLACSHASHDQEGYCSTCGVGVSHSFSGNTCTVCGKVTAATSVKIHFVDAVVWQNVTGYVWKQKGSATTALNSWPGEIVNKDANGYFTMNLDYKPVSGESLGFIFTNFNGGQTTDVIIDYATLSSGEVWIKPNNWTNGDGKYDCYVTTVESSMVLSPEIHGTSVTFRYENSSASKVYVAGSFNNWSTSANKLTKGSDGIWTTTMTLSEGVHEYKLVVDGDWILDPKNGLIGGFDGNSLVVIGNAGSTTASDITVKLHFYRESGDYANWDAWMWSNTNEGQGCTFTNDATYKGKTATFTIPGGTNSYVNYKIRKTDWSDEEFYTRSIDISNIKSGTVHFFIRSGEAMGSTVYGNDVIKMGKPTYANLDYNSGNIWVKTPLPVSGDFTKAFSIVKSDGSASGITVTGVTMDNNGYSLSLSRKPTLIEVHNLVVKCGTTMSIKTEGLFYSSGFANDYTYYGNDLGATWSKKSTTFKVWAPTATGVSVMLFRGGNHGGDDWISTTPMTLGEKGVYTVTISGDLDGTYYNFLVNFPGYTTEATDPYAKTTGANGDRGMIINMDAYDPEGWDKDLSPNQGMNYTDAIIYEMHVREMTIDSTSGVKEAWRGKYLGLTQEGTNYQGRATALDHIKELGVTHVQLMPVYDHAGVDEYHLTDWQQYAWGYNPKNFNVPEGSFATDPYNGEVRVTEMKQMVQAFHSKGINVVMDVVYNHTYDGGNFCYNKIVPNYFSRFWAENNWSNGSGVGNDFATERSMARNYIVDSIYYWVEEYHIDGFRFDLAGLIDIQTINEVISTVQARYPYVIFYGEGWAVGGTAIQDGHWTATKENAWQTGSMAFYNDSFRNDIAGDNGGSWGFATGDSGKADKIGSYFRASNGWSNSPSQTINYVSCHDNYTLIDKIIISRNGAYWDQMVKMNNMSAAIYMLAQGIPYIYSGEELLREKKDEWGNRYHNTYDSSDYITKIRWNDLVDKDYAQVTDDYYAGLVNFRKNHAALRNTNGADAWGYTQYYKINDHCIMFYVSGYPNYECSDGIVIIYNANEGTQWLNIYDYGVPYGNWQACIHGMTAGVNPLWSTYDGSVGVEGLSTTVLVLGDLVHEESVYNNQSYSCSHGYHNQSGLCWDCGAKVDHYFVNGYCNHCNLAQSASGSMTIYFDNSASQWGNVYAYAWTETGGRTTTYTAAWPGDQMTKVSGNVFAVTVPCAANNIIFTDNYGNQTVTQGLIKNDNGVLTSNLFYTDSASWGNYTETCGHASHNGDGICNNCGVDVGHDWNNGYCSGCSTSCSHSNHNASGYCTNCSANVGHSWNNGTCGGCNKVCTHSWSSGKCTNCGMTCSHSYHDQNGSCYTCGYSVGHSYYGGLCSACGVYKQGYIESQSYYLVGYINGGNYGCEEDYQNLGSYKFTSGKLTTTFASDSYVYVKTGDNASYYMTDGYQEGVSSATLYDSRTVAGDKLYVPGGKEVTFTLSVNSSNNTMTLSYTVEDPVCSHSYTSKVTTAATCTTEGVKTFTCTKCGDSYTQPIAVIDHSYANGSCTACGKLDPNYTVTDTGYVLVTDISQITAGGKFILVANNGGTYQAMGTTLASGKFAPVTVTVDGRLITGSNLPVWTIESVSGGIALSIDGSYLNYNSSTNFKFADSAYTWSVTAGENGFILSASSRGIFYSISAAKFGAYASSNVSSSSYVSNLQLYKYQVGTQGCSHSYSSKVTTAATCTTAGVKTFTCNLCGDSYTESIAALGHNFESGKCTVCGTADPNVSVDTGYYLFGYINGADCGMGADLNNPGPYKFVNGKLTVTFTEESYVAVKTGDNSKFFMTNGWLGSVTSATLYTFTDPDAVSANKLQIPGGQTVTFTLTENWDGNLNISYVVDATTCVHVSHDTDGICSTCGANVEHTFVSGVCTICYKAQEGYDPYDYYLYGYINGANYGCEDDYQNLGIYKFVDGKLTVTFDADSYIGVKEVYPNGKFGAEVMAWYVTDGWLGNEITSATLYNSTSVAAGDRLYVPGGVELTITMTKNTDGTITLSYVKNGPVVCDHSYTSKVTTAATCTAEGVMTYTCSKCGDSYTQAIAMIAHSYANGNCTVCGKLDPNYTVTDTGYVLVTDLSQITNGGKFILVANNGGTYQAMGTTLASGKFAPVTVTVDGRLITGSNLPVWTIESVSGGITLSIDGSYLAYNSSTNFKMDSAAYTWTVTAGEDGFILDSSATTRGIYYSISAAKFGAYSTSYVNSSSYISNLQLYKYQVGTQGCAHSYTSKVTTAATCNKAGVKTFTCSLCGHSYTEAIPTVDHSFTSKVTTAATCTTAGVKTFTCGTCGTSYTEAIAATGHSYVSGKCEHCGAVQPTVDFYLFGYINGANYACEEDYENLGIYKFENGTLNATFDCDSYVAVKTGDNMKWYMTQGWQGEVSSVNLYDTTTITDVNKMYVPGNVKVTFTLSENADGSLTLSYVTAPAECRHTYAATKIKAATCTSYAVYALTCSACGESSTVSADQLAKQWLYAVPTGMSSSEFTGKTMYRYRDYTSGGWVALGTNTISYVNSWPSGFDTSNSLYSQYNNKSKKVSGYESASSKLTVDSDQIVGYLYYHWCYDGYPYTVANKTGSYTRFHAYFSTKAPSEANKHDASDDSYRFDDSTACDDSNWYFYVPVYGQTYTTYTNGSGWGSWSDWSSTKVTASSTREVETATMYNFKAATLASHSYVSGTCSVCGDGCSHSYTSKVTTAATCESGGIKTFTCSKCAHSYTEAIAATGHSFANGSCTICGATDPSIAAGTYYLVGYINGADYGCEGDWENAGIYKFVNGKLTATFTQDSYIFVKTEDNGKWLLADSYCEDTTCTFRVGGTEKMYVPGGSQVNFTLVENADGSVTVSYTLNGAYSCDHSYTEKITTPATCTTNGVKTYTCTKCGAVYTVTFAANGHSYTSKVTTAATCTVNGVKTFTCSACGDSYTEVIAASGHKYSNGKCTVCGNVDPNCSHSYTSKVTTSPTCTATGLRTYTCTKCGDVYNETIAANGHKFVDTVVPPTCELNGYTTHTCSVCGVSNPNTDVVNPIGHDYSKYVVTAPTCTAQGYTTYTCQNCGNVKVWDYTNAVGHNYLNGYCITCGAQDPNYAAPGATTYYLVGYINGADYGSESDYQNMGIYKFVDGKLTVTFTQDSYIFIKTEGNGKWLLANSYCTDTTCTFAEGGSEKMFVPGNVQVTFTLVENANGSVTVSYTTSGSSASVVPTLTLKAPTLEFKDMITVNAMYTAENIQDVVEMGMITYSYKASSWSVATAEHVIPGATYDATTGRYVSASQGIHAKYLGDTVYLAVYAKLSDGTYAYSKLAGYSPVQYATSKLSGTDTALKQLVVAMLNYGAAAQVHFGHNTGALANASLTAAQKALPAAYNSGMVGTVPAASTAKQGIFANNSGFAKKYPSISFEGAFCINYFFTPNYAPSSGITLYYWNEADYNANSVLSTSNATGKFKLSGSGTGEYSGSITGISAKALSEAVYVACAYKDSNGTVWTSGVLGYSIGAYCSSQATKGGTIADLAMATAVYGYHAKQYFG